MIYSVDFSRAMSLRILLITRLPGWRHTARTVITLSALIFQGWDPKDVQVEAEGNLLSITGERKGEASGPEYRETFYGKFERQLACRRA